MIKAWGGAKRNPRNGHDIWEQALKARLEIWFGVALCRAYLLAPSALGPLLNRFLGFRFAPPQALIGRAFGAEDHRFVKLALMTRSCPRLERPEKVRRWGRASANGKCRSPRSAGPPGA